MKQAFENIIKATPQNKQPYVIKQLQLIANRISYLEEVEQSNRATKTGVKQNERHDILERCIDILKLHGYAPANITGFTDEYLNFMLKNTSIVDKYKAELINFNILNSLQTAYFMYNIEFDKEPENYFVLRDFMLNWDDIIEEKTQKTLKSITNGI